MTTQPNASVTLPVSQAIDRMKLLLFQPFDIGKWFVIGFCAWLAHLGEQGGANFNFGRGYGGGDRNMRQGFEHAKDYVMDNLHWIIPMAITVVVLLFALGLLFMWLNSRGKFMFLHCVALNKAEIAVPWDKFAREANSLFWFRLVLGLIGATVTLPLVVVIVLTIIGMVRHGRATATGIMLAAGLVMVLLAIGLVFAVIQKFTTDFVVPIMFLHGKKCLEAWREFHPLLTANAAQFALYILFSIVLAIIIGIMVILIVILTCCIAGCFLAIPYLGTVLLLPVLAFKRAYSLHYLAQYGTEYDVFQSLNQPGAATPVV